MKVKEKQIQKIIPKQIKKMVNNNNPKESDKRNNYNKKKLLISKTLSMENLSTGQKYTTRQKSSISGNIFNNSVEEFDYLNFSDIDIDLIKKITSYEKDIFKPELYTKNQDYKKDIVQNRYNIIDTSFDTNLQEEDLNKTEDEYIEINKNILIKTPSTICNYYDMDSDKKNIKNKNIEDKKNKISKNKQIQITNKSIINYNNPIYTNRIKQTKHNSSSNINLPQNSKRIYSNTNVGFYKNKKNSNNINSNVTKIKSKEVMTPITNDRNKKKIKKVNSQIKTNYNNLMKSYLDSNKKYNNKTHSNKNEKYLSIKKYSEYIANKVTKNDKKNSYCNFTFNNDITTHLNRKQNIQELFDSIKEIKETINNNLNQNTLNESNENKDNQNIIHQKPIMLCLNKPKFNSYFKTPKNSNSDKKTKATTTSVNQYKSINLGNNNIILPNYTGRNYQQSSESTRRDIVVKRKDKGKKKDNGCLYINYCMKSINSNMNMNNKNNDNNSAKMNITFHNYINDCIDKPLIRVNLKKHIKSSSQLMKFVNVNSKHNKTKSNKKTETKNKIKNSRSLFNNKSFINSCTKRSINSSQLIKELLTKEQITKSPIKSKNNKTTLDFSKSTIEKNINNIKKDKDKPKSKKNLVCSNNKKYYSINYELNLKSNGSTKMERNKNNKIFNKNNKSKNYFKPKTQSDIKLHNFNIKEENKENTIKYDNAEYGMDKRVKQKLLDRMNKATKNTFGNIWGNKKKNDNSSEIMKSPFINKEYFITHKNFYNKKIISIENSKNEERDYKNDKCIEKRNKFEFNIS